MSYNVMPYAVDLSRVETAIASRDDALLRALVEACDPECAEDEGWVNEDTAIEGGQPVPSVTLHDALRHFVYGEPLHVGWGHQYGYALELLCGHFGQMLDNAMFCSMGASWFDEIQEGVAERGVSEDAFDVYHLFYRGSPIVIPDPDDFPGIGYARLAELPAMIDVLEKADFSEVDEEVKEAVDQICAWLMRCHGGRCDLVTFYY